MVISITSTRVTPEQERRTDDFLRTFLPRLSRQPGVLHIFHFMKPELSESTTIIIWTDETARLAYRESALVKDAMAFERELGLTTVREAYPLS